MIVVTHDGISANIDAVDLRKGAHFLLYPLTAMFIVSLRGWIFTA